MILTSFSTFIEPSTVVLHLSDPNWVIVDCRFDLSNPTKGETDYKIGHIPGAVYANLNFDLSGPTTPISGRHPLPSSSAFLERLSNWGIDGQKQVVVYDASGGAFASRLWWLMRYHGLYNVAILNGGITRWMAENLPISSVVVTPKKTGVLSISAKSEMVVNADEIDRIRRSNDSLLVDARTADRFAGLNENIDRIAGHIPGAVNRWFGLNLLQDGILKPREQLMDEFHDLLQGRSPENLIVYCGSGVTSILHLAVMEWLGLKGARLYPGSWSEWIQDPALPIATGIS
jgi:thiosulfate/3-mercaptopyruvate sulfurtransferase